MLRVASAVYTSGAGRRGDGSGLATLETYG